MNFFMNHGVRCFLGCILMGVLLVISGCAGGTEIGNPAAQAEQATTFADEQELEAYIKDQFATTLISYEGIMPEADGGTMEPETSNSYTTTNTQEAGVDEADTVKTDGVYQYVATADTVKVVKAVPYDTMQWVSTIPVKGRVDSLYLYPKANLLVIIWNPAAIAWSQNSNLDIMLPYWICPTAKTGISFVDITDPAKPKQIKSVVADGNLVSSRLASGRLHIIQQFRPDLPPLQNYYDGTEQSRQKTVAHNKALLASLALKNMVPSIEVSDGNDQPQHNGLLVDVPDFCRPSEPGGGSIVTVMTFRLDDPALPFRSIGMVADANVTYASTRALYLTSTAWNQATDAQSWAELTKIYKFDIASEKIRYAGSGKVSGRILNQFSLGEYDDVLRIATTVYAYPGPWLNNVYCLKADGERLKTIGKIENMAPGERIYAVRFMGKRGFVVTFRQIDPLFALDLSDPSAPSIKGALKVPGYSSYIHPIGEDYLLTIGKDVLVQGGIDFYQGLQLSIFNVSNLQDPQLVHKEMIGVRGSESEALFNHKAVTYWEDKGLLALPVDLAGYQAEIENRQPWEQGVRTFSGLYVYQVSTLEGFKLLGRISTTTGIDQMYANWTRGIFIGDAVYAVDGNGVRSALVDDINNTLFTLLFKALD